MNTANIENFLDFAYNQIIGYSDIMKIIEDDSEDDTKTKQRKPHPVLLYRNDDIRQDDWGMHFTIMSINWKILCDVTIKKPSKTIETPVKSTVDLSTELDNYFKPKEIVESIESLDGAKPEDVLALIDLKVYSWKDRDNDGKNDTTEFNNIPVMKDDYRAIGGICSHLTKMWEDEWKEMCKVKGKKDKCN